MSADDHITYVTVDVGGQMFGIAISRVREVFGLERLTRVPLASSEIAGVLNLRGRIVTAIDLRTRLGLPAKAVEAGAMAVGVDYQNEAFALLVDHVGDVLALSAASREDAPPTLDPRWSQIATGVHRLDGGLMLVLDVDRALEFRAVAQAA
ncbi:chemotaxis protein CheW [Methylopila jiangsuensis]|uniref:Chemotaxis protein CheW n=1 Tax=Methylopila jiangsuensis TaxID=586230 RepID=A0A9W6JGL5_9HYPH|nr:chemotaxis protein CheW [Methylopila jiangsuensis]MDR6286428.1 purine-binding chemotaxis protein CheW [Methylopila jiangsuensis]GLK77235.1 chemotaxis protein CheW [Methylopila jiangsuensis]